MQPRSSWLLTLGILAGVLWAVQAQTLVPSDARLQAMSIGDPKIFVAPGFHVCTTPSVSVETIA